MAGNRRPEGKTSLQVWIDEETHLKFKTLCTLRKIKMTEVTAKLIDDWIAEEEDKNPWMKAIK
ncbi:hypothetical protein K3712_000526 [Escherichia coli]|nr:hypothetical protein [Escherichia coli]